MASVCRRAGIIGTVLLMAPAFAFAEDGKDADDAIDVRTDEVVVTATRFTEELDVKRPVNLTVITRQEIEASPARTVPEVLAGQVGVVPSDLFGNNGTNTIIDLRGFGVTGGQNTLILVNGRRVSDIDLSGVKWSSIPLSSVERIEIVRGTGSVLYGDGAVAGVVNIITRSPSGESSRATVGARYGSFDTREAKIDATLLKDQYGLNINAYTYSSDGYRDNNETDDSVLKLDLRRAGISNDVSLRIGADRQDVRLPGGRRVEPSAGINELEDDRRGTSTPLDFATRDGGYATLALSSRQDIGLIDAELGYRDKAQTSYFYFGGFPDYRETDLGVWSLTPRMKIPADLFGRQNQLVIGLDFYSWDYQLDVSNDPANIGTPINRVRATQRDYAYYLHDILTLTDTMQLSLGWREQWQEIEATDDYDPTAPGGAFGSEAPDGEQDLREHAYDLGLRYELTTSWSVLASTGRSFRFATIDEIYEFSPTFQREFQFLRPQTAQNIDIGVERRWNAQLLRATVFQIDVEDEIHLDPYSTGIGNTNLPPSRRRGVELESALSFKEVNLGASYAYTEAKFLEGTFSSVGGPVDISGNTVPLVPRHKVTAYARWLTSEKSFLTMTFRYASEQFMDNDEANDFGTKIPAYSVFDLKYSHDIANWRLGLVVNNLFDKQYYAYAVRSLITDAYNAYPLPERTVTAFAEYRFGR
ncbi:MAG: TonB-dependent receptor [Betaproteobacteria bacterium]|nr:MAG: TonB-dependent receptor [Betaproteobacteria bacterium]